MAYSKVILNGTTLIDVTQKTVTASTLLQGETALKNDGTDVTGTYVPQTCVLQSKTVSPSTSQQTVTPDSGYDALSSVTVNAMPSGSASTPATSITANPTISVSASGLITASVSGSKSVTPSVSAGYVASGTAGTVSVSGSNTQQLSTQSAQTITPTTTNQTIASGKYLTGVQTILGDANLLAENIKKDVVIFGITGTYEGDVPSGYTVTVSLTNPVNASDFGYCKIYEATSGTPYSSLVQIGEITSATGSTSVSVSTDLYGIAIELYSDYVYGDASMISCTGGASYTTGNTSSQYVVAVTGDGTVTLNGINWYDD